jgi:carbon-monoxide dehydrogenase iron sulfur subunit
VTDVRTMSYIAFHPEKCTYCEMCSGVCSLSKLGRVQPRGACITIDRDAADPFGAITCSVCDMSHDRVCVDSCPEEALVYDEKAGVVRFVQDRCTMCETCLAVCDNVHLDAVGERIMICDLCDGDPLCVKWCPEGALTWEGRA